MLSPDAFDVESRFLLGCWSLLALGELAVSNLGVFPLLLHSFFLFPLFLEATQSTRTLINPMPMNVSPPPLLKVARRNQSQTATTLALALSDNLQTLLVETFSILLCPSLVGPRAGRAGTAQRASDGPRLAPEYTVYLYQYALALALAH